MLSSVFVCDVQDTIYYKIREGQIVTDFYRPIPLLACYLADDIGGMLSAFLLTRLLLCSYSQLFFWYSLAFVSLEPAFIYPQLLIKLRHSMAAQRACRLNRVLGDGAWQHGHGQRQYRSCAVGQHRSALVFPGKRPRQFRNFFHFNIPTRHR